MKRVLLVLLIGLFIFGCASTPRPIPPECEGSLIYPVLDEYRIGTSVFKIGVIEVIRRNPEIQPKALEVMKDLRAILENPKAMYTGFAYVVMQNVEKLNQYVSAGSIIVATELITETFTEAALEINQCDRELLLRDVLQLESLLKTL